VDVAVLLDRVRWFRTAHTRAVRLRIPQLAASDAERWEGRINAQLRICGCFSGALMALLAAIGGAGYAILRLASGGAVTWSTVWACGGAILAAAAAGKLGGLAIGQVRLRRSLAGLLRSLEVPR